MEEPYIKLLKFLYKVYIKFYIKKSIEANIIKELKEELIIEEDYPPLDLYKTKRVIKPSSYLVKVLLLI